MVTTTLGRVVLTFSGIALDRAGRLRSMITAKRRSASGRFISFHNRSRVRCTNERDTADFDVERASASTFGPTGSCPRRY